MDEARDHLRAADVDRQAVADRLREAVDEGRLSLGEYDERLGRAYAAQTYGDLAPLLADLPQAAQPADPPGGTAPGRPAAPRPRVVFGPWLSAVLICTAIWGVTCLYDARLHYFWPGWVALPWGAALLARTLGGRTVGGRAAGGPYGAGPYGGGETPGRRSEISEHRRETEAERRAERDERRREIHEHRREIREHRREIQSGLRAERDERRRDRRRRD